MRARIPKTMRQHEPKPQPWKRNGSHRTFVASLPCLRCGHERTPNEPNVCAHVRIGTDGAASRKPSDNFTVSLCVPCHDLEQSWNMGERRFWSSLGIDPLDTAARLWAVSGDIDKGRRAIDRARARMALS